MRMPYDMTAKTATVEWDCIHYIMDRVSHSMALGQLHPHYYTHYWTLHYQKSIKKKKPVQKMQQKLTKGMRELFMRKY